MTKSSFSLTLFFLVCFSIPLTATAQTVNIPDPNLRAAIATQLGKPSGATITTEDMANLTELTARNASIRDLTGLEAATNLTFLGLDNNSIADISPLAGLTNLTRLNLVGSSISDLSPLVTNAGLGAGDIVYVSKNPLSPASVNTHIPALRSRGVTVEFSGLVVNIPDPNLRAAIEAELGKASGNTITTEDMKRLTDLEAPNANITDLTGLEHATNLTWLDLDNNSISDLSPLVANTGLGPGDTVLVEGNPLNNAAINTHIPALQRRFVDVHFDKPVNIPDPNLRTAIKKALRKASGDTITTEDMKRLPQLIAPNASITDLTGLEGATNLTRLDLHNNFISDLSSLVANTGLGPGDTVLVNGNPLNNAAINTHIHTLISRGVTVHFDKPVNIPDSNLRAAIEKALGKASGDTITTADMKRLPQLIAPNASITDLTGLEGATNLTRLDLHNNSISDLSSLVANTGLGPGDTVLVNGNPLNNAAINTHIHTLISRGVTVHFDKPVNIPDPNLRTAIEKALGKASGDTITTADMKRLPQLIAPNTNIRNLTGLEHATNLTRLALGAEQVAGGSINSNSISDISPLAGLNKLTVLFLTGNSISNISPVAGLTNLTSLSLWDNSISDISPVVGLTNLTELFLGNNSISGISPVAGLTNLTSLSLRDNSISDISPVVRLTNLTELFLGNNSISDISPVAGLTNLTSLSLRGNSISDISPVAGLINLIELSLENNSISDISPLVANTGLGSGDTVDVGANPLNYASIHTHIPALQRRGVEVYFENLKPTTLEYILSIPAGINLIHVPLKVTAVDGVEQTITSISDLYNALGGASKVNFLITYDSSTQEWLSYFVPSDKGRPADRALTDDIGIIAGMIAPTSVRLSGNPLGTDGSSTITVNPGLNVVGLPLKDPRITRVSNLFALEGIGGNVTVIILTDGGEFKLVGRAGDPGDIEITGGQAFILIAQQLATVTISGDGWTTSGIAAAPPMALTGIEVGDTTPVLGLRGAVVDEKAGLKVDGFRVTVKNLSTGRAVAAVTAPDEAGYRLTVVDIETGRAATIGDTLEISAQSPNPFIGVKPLRYTITAEDVKRSRIQLPELVAYEIPAETQLMPNYPNPFNPETWIPYRLAEDALVTLTIYDLNGQVVRTIDVGHQIAAVYEGRSKAVYWDGRNGLGEQVASGVYFYHLSAGDYSATRKMLILK